MTARLVNVLMLRMLCVDPVVDVNDTVANVTPVPVVAPPVTLTALAEQNIVDVPALNVRLVLVVKSIAVDALNVTVLLPRVMVLVLLLVDNRAVAVMLLLFASSVPWVTVTEPLEVSESPRVVVMPLPLITIGPSVLFALVRVPVPSNVVVPE